MTTLPPKLAVLASCLLAAAAARAAGPAAAARRPARMRLLFVRSARGRAPWQAPQDLNAFADGVGRALDARKPDLVVVETSLGAPGGAAAPGTGMALARAYGLELALACAQAHQRGVKCANGPLSAQLSERMAWLALLEAGKPDEACAFANAAFAYAGKPAVKTACVVKTASDIPPALAPEIADGKALLAALQRSPADYVNFAWKGREPAALTGTAAALQKATGKPLVSSDLEAAPGASRAALEKAAKDAGLAYAAWRAPAARKPRPRR